MFWWSAPGEDATRVEIELEPDAERTRLRVVESRPFALLDLYGAEVVRAFPAHSVARAPQPELLAR